MCLGIAWASFGWMEDELHAANWVLLDDGSFLWIEPEDGTTHELGECRGGLTLVVV